MSDEAAWLRSRAVLELSWSRQARGINFPSRLRIGLRNGLITGRARIAELTNRGHTRAVTREEHWIAPKDVWLGSIDNSRLDLDGDYYTTGAIGTGYSRIALSGLSFNKAELLEFIDLGEEVNEEPSDQEHQNAGQNAIELTSNAGARPKAEDWSKFAAALVAIHEQQSIRLDEPESQVWERVKQHLFDRGHPCLGIDTVRPALRRAKAWTNGQPFVDDTGRPNDEDA